MARWLGQLELFPLPKPRRAAYQLQLPLIGGRFHGFLPEEKPAEQGAGTIAVQLGAIQ
jgi:hypothetical protein